MENNMENNIGFCNICGEKYNLDDLNVGNIRTIMKEQKVCFTHAFWIEKVQIHDENTMIVQDLKYPDKLIRFHGGVINKKTTNNFVFLGSSGRDYFAKFFLDKNGNKLENPVYKWYNNVWCQGEYKTSLLEIEQFKILKPNCIFISREEYLRNVHVDMKSLEHGSVMKGINNNGEEFLLLFDKVKFCFYPYDEMNKHFICKFSVFESIIQIGNIVIPTVAEDYECRFFDNKFTVAEFCDSKKYKLLMERLP